MLGPLEGLCQIILEHMFRLCCWHVPNTHEMSIKLVRPARITLEKPSVFAFVHRPGCRRPRFFRTTRPTYCPDRVPKGSFETELKEL